MADKHHMFFNAVARFVSGDMSKKQEKTHRGQPIAPDKQNVSFGVAILKTDPDLARIFTEIKTYCSTVWANDGAKLNALNNWFGGNFDALSMKIKDGAAPNSEGKVNENTKDHYVFYFTTKEPEYIKACNPARQHIDINTIKRGDFVQMSLSIADNGLNVGDGCGIYLNPTYVTLVAEGDPIAGGVSAEDAYAGSTIGALPPGARPLGSNIGMAPSGLPAGNVTSPVQGLPQTGNVHSLPGVAPTTQTSLPATQPTAFPSNGLPQPHTGILGTPQTGTGQVQTGLPQTQPVMGGANVLPGQ